jgi:hypothetical protein
VPTRRSTYIVPTDGMQGAFDRGEPVLLLPPDWPEGNDALMALFIDVVMKGSEGRLRIMPTEAVDR